MITAASTTAPILAFTPDVNIFFAAQAAVLVPSFLAFAMTVFFGW
ncbi:MAG: hypothetical protein ACI8UX_002035 [Psychromonas sp.]|jgi:hypothetical protein